MSINLTAAQWIEIPGPITCTANQAAMSISLWINLHALPVADNFNLAAWATGTGVTRFGLNCRNAASGTIRVIARALDADALTSVETTGTPLTPGLWQHIVGTVNYVSSGVQLFVNAVSQTIVGATAFGATATSNTNSTLARIGANLTANSEFVNGMIEDVRIYQRVLSQAEITTIFTAKGMDHDIQSIGQRYTLNDQATGVLVGNVDNISNIDRIVGTNPSGTNANFGDSYTTNRRRRANVVQNVW